MKPGDPMIPRLPHPWPTGAYPYEVFAGTGISPRSTHGDILDRALELQAEGKLSIEARLAYDCLRILSRRLATDFFLYNPELTSPEELAADALNLLTTAHSTEGGR